MGALGIRFVGHYDTSQTLAVPALLSDSDQKDNALLAVLVKPLEFLFCIFRGWESFVAFLTSLMVRQQHVAGSHAVFSNNLAHLRIDITLEIGYAATEDGQLGLAKLSVAFNIVGDILVVIKKVAHALIQ